MDELITILKDIHKEIRSERPKGGKLNGNSAYRNGFEDGYKLITKRMKGFIETIPARSELDSGTTSAETHKS